MLNDILNKANPWWLSGRVSEPISNIQARSEIASLMKACSSHRITAILGARRVGKSTLLMHTIDNLLRQGVQNSRILYFSGDNPALIDANTSTILDHYFSELLHESDTVLSQKVYIFIDEVHILKNWQLHLKDYYDRQCNIKFFVSGSSAAHLMLQSKESLQGRIERRVIFPLKFSQFASHQAHQSEKDQNLERFLSHTIDWLDPKNAAENYQETYNKLSINCEPKANNLIQRYLLCGGYPEVFKYDDTRDWLSHLAEDIIYAAIYKDIINIFNIKNPELLEKLLYAISDNHGQGFSYTTLGETVGLDRLTASVYADYLQKAYLINIAESYSKNAAKTIRKNKKLFISDCGIRNAILREHTLTDKSRGLLVEGAVYNSLRQFADNSFAKVGYWREGNQEVDAVLNLGNKLLPVEVKYRNQFTERDLSGLHAFMREFDCDCGVVITKNQLAIKDKVVYLPFWLV